MKDIKEQIKDLELDIEEIKNGKQKEFQPYLYMFERELQLLNEKVSQYPQFTESYHLS